MKVYLSSPSTTQQTYLAKPRSQPESYSIEFTGLPPQASVMRSMFLLLVLRRAIMLSLASCQRQMGSIPFQLKIAKDYPYWHILRLKSMIFWHRWSVNLRSDSASFFLSSALEKKKLELTSVFSYYRLTLQVRILTFVSFLGIFACLEPWSRTNPLTSLESDASLCTMCIISIMWRSIGVQGLRMISTASTTISTS